MKDRTAHTPELLKRKLLQLSALVEENARRCVLAIRSRDRTLASPPQTERLIHLLSISRYLERMVDYATNIAENVVYVAEGTIIRHRLGDKQD